MFEDYRKRMSRFGNYQGEIMRKQSEVVMDATWMNSVSTYPVVVHFINKGLPPMYECADDYDQPLYAHFETKSVYNAGGNEPTYYLTFAPGVITKNQDIKVGAYVNLPDVNGVCSYWLIVHIDDDNLLTKCQILRCTWNLKWVSNNIIHSVLGVLRTGTSESIGIETVGQMSTVDSDIFIWIPSNEDSLTISYDTRFLISDKGRIPPLAWKTSRLRDVGPSGITRLSLTQDLYNSSTDNTELMLADYNINAIQMEEDNNKQQEFAIAFNGTKPSVKVGSYKTFTAELSEDNHFDILWNVIVDDVTYSTNSYDNSTHTYGDYTMVTTDRTLQLKVAQNYDLVGKVLTIQAVCANGAIGNTKVEVVS